MSNHLAKATEALNEASTRLGDLSKMIAEQERQAARELAELVGGSGIPIYMSTNLVPDGAAILVGSAIWARMQEFMPDANPLDPAS